MGCKDNVECWVVKLVEFGLRMKFCMIKVEEGLCLGKVMWYEYVYKIREEIRELEKKWE